jgi:hypothetical protein
MSFRNTSLLCRAAIGALLVAILFATMAPAQPPADSGPVDEQTRIFRRSLFLLKFKPLKSFDELDKDSILVLLGDTHRLMEVPGGLNRFLQQGGAALIASDKPMDAGPRQQLHTSTGVVITGYTCSSNQDNLPVFYKGIPECPWMVSNDSRFMRHPNTGETLVVATNVPSTLEKDALGRPRFTAREFAWLPNLRFTGVPPERLIGGPHERKVISALFGVADDVGSGRVIVLADHSIFIDEMMRPRDNNNVEFTANCMNYLRDGDHRTKVLFVEDGAIQSNFEVSTKRKGSPDVLEKTNKVLEELDKKLGEAEESDAWNRKLMDFLTWLFDNEGRHPSTALRRATIAVLIVATLMLLLYGCYRLGVASLFRREVGVPAVARAVRGQTPNASLIEQRHTNMLEAGNVGEAGRQLIRDAFEAAGVAAPAPYREPAVKVPGAWWWRRRNWQQRVCRLWRLAFRERPRPLAPREVRPLLAELEELKAALKNGTVQIA